MSADETAYLEPSEAEAEAAADNAPIAEVMADFRAAMAEGDALSPEERRARNTAWLASRH